MGNLTELLPQYSQTVTSIYEWWRKRGESQPKRGYLGGSEIGHHCERFLWYKFREAAKEEFPGRMYRLFERGQREEATFVEELKGIGCTVHEVGEDGKQFEVVDINGHFKGHADGVAYGLPEAPKTWHLLEMKTSSTKEFKKVKDGGVEKVKPQHFSQMQVYMHLLGLTRALYIVACKETDELYSERIPYQKNVAKGLLERARRIIQSPDIPERPYPRSDYYLCSWCPAKDLCWGEGTHAVPINGLSCRQCCHATPVEDGQWRCEKGHATMEPCADHLFLPGFVESVGTPADATENTITYLHPKYGEWIHGPGEDHVRSVDLITMPRDLIFTGTAEDAGGHEDDQWNQKN